LVPSAKKLDKVSFEEMLEIAATGGRVLALRSVEYARNHRVDLHVRSSFTWEPGTWVVREDSKVEQAIVSAVTHDTSQAKITVSRVPDKPGIAARLFRGLADRSINVDMIEQNTSVSGHTDISFTVPKGDFPLAFQVANELSGEIEASDVVADEAIGMVSLVGAGMKTHPAIAAQMFETLANEKINIEMISTSSIRISCVVAESDVERAVQSLHASFSLSG
jgi:aspartate kinase